MNVVGQKLLAARQESRATLKAIFDTHTGEASVVQYTPKTWSALIGLALSAGITFEKFGEEFGTAAEDVAEWVDGKMPNRPETVVMVVEFIGRQVSLFSLESAA